MKKVVKNFLILFFLILYALTLIFSQKYIENYFFSFIAEPILNIPEIKIIRKEKPKPEIEARSVLVFRMGRKEKILFENNADEVLPIASLSKLMTAVIATESYDPNQKIKISKRTASQELVPNYGNLKEGEIFSVEQLLKLMLVYSSNHAAYALAEGLGVENFISKMNQKAKEIGMENTKFFNPTGLRDGSLNVSTAEDLLKLVKYILKEKPEIFEMSKRKGSYEVLNSIFDIKLPQEKKLVGGKTGYLPETGGCMIYVFENESGIIFANIILGTKTVEERVRQMQKLVDWIFYE